MFLRLEAARVPITHVPEVTVTYRYAGASVSADRLTSAFRAFCDRQGLGAIPWIPFLDLALGEVPPDLWEVQGGEEPG